MDTFGKYFIDYSYVGEDNNRDTAIYRDQDIITINKLNHVDKDLFEKKLKEQNEDMIRLHSIHNVVKL